MENPFKKILSNEKVPEILRKKVLDDVTLINLSLDIADLMAVKYPNTVEELLKTKNKK